MSNRSHSWHILHTQNTRTKLGAKDGPDSWTLREGTPDSLGRGVQKQARWGRVKECPTAHSCSATLQHIQTSTDCCLVFAQRLLHVHTSHQCSVNCVFSTQFQSWLDFEVALTAADPGISTKAALGSFSTFCTNLCHECSIEGIYRASDEDICPKLGPVFGSSDAMIKQAVLLHPTPMPSLRFDNTSQRLATLILLICEKLKQNTCFPYLRILLFQKGSKILLPLARHLEEGRGTTFLELLRRENCISMLCPWEPPHPNTHVG